MTMQPCLMLLLEGEPELTLWPEITLTVGGEPLMVDALVSVRDGDATHWFLVEIDEDGVVTDESRWREVRMGLPTLRFRDADNLLPRVLERVKQHLGRVA